jgi:hypothetical protein
MTRKLSTEQLEDAERLKEIFTKASVKNPLGVA